MKILLYATNFWPEVTGSGKYNGELAEWFVKQGHQVDVIAAPPHYPQWAVADTYKNKGWFKETWKGVTIYRAPISAATVPSGKGRILQELSFGLSSLLWWFRLAFHQYDIVFSVCPPLQIGVYPYFYKLLTKTPYIFHVQDLQVDVAVRLNMLRNRFLIRSLSQIETFLLRHATVVSSISVGMKKNIIQKGVDDRQYYMLPNWVDLTHVRPLFRVNSFRQQLDYKESDQIILYSGNMGEKQGIEVIIEAADRLRNESSIKFLLCGEGVAQQKLQQLAISKQLANVQFLPLQSYEQLPNLLAIADLHLIVQRQAASDVVMPSKLTSILAAGGVSIVTADEGTSLAEVILKHKLGWVVEPENVDALTQQIIDALLSDKLSEFSINARNYAIQYLGLESVLKEFETFLLKEVLINN